MPNFKKARGFNLRSGNKPNMSSFKMMGSTTPSPITSPYKQTDEEYTKMQAESAKNDPRYGKMSPEEYKKEVQRQVKSKKETGSWNANNTNTAGAELGKAVGGATEEETEVSTDDAVEGIKGSEDGGGGASVMGKIAKGAKGALGAAFQGLTHGLDAVYGTGKVNTNNSVTFSEPKEKKDKTISEKTIANK
tara:strand:+ start:299 stop:871 length:573 start_codon:yes stop_codon:yes gene_type:complete